MKQNKPYSWLPIVFGLCFFANPLVAGVDVLPDWIGALLVAWGLRVPAAAGRTLRDARGAFLKVAAADAVKDLALLAVLGSGSPSETPTSILIVAFAGAVVRLYFLISAISLLFDGMLALAMEGECALLYEARRRGLSHPELLRRATAAFLIVRELLCILPELASLANSSYIDSDAVNLYQYIGVMRGFAAIAALVAGAVWLIRVLLFFRIVRRNAAFGDYLKARYIADQDAHPSAPFLRRFAVSFFCIGLGFVLFADLTIDGYQVLPDGLGAAFCLLGILLLPLPWRQKLPATLSLVPYGVAATLSGNFAVAFSENHAALSVLRDPAAAADYARARNFAILSLVLFLVFYALLLRTVRTAFLSHGLSLFPQSDGFESRAGKRMQAETDGQWLKCYVFGFFSAVLSFLRVYLLSFIFPDRWRFLEAFWIFDFAFAVIFAAVFAFALSAAYEILKKHTELSA